MKYLNYFAIIGLAVLTSCTTTSERVKYVPIASTCPTFHIDPYPKLDNDIEISIDKVQQKVQMSKDDFLKLIKSYKEYKKFYNSLYVNINEFNSKVNELNMELRSEASRFVESSM